MTEEALLSAWKNSRDSRARTAGSKGTDGISAEQFSAKLTLHLSRLRTRLKRGEFGFSSLRPFFIPKANSNKERLICVPTVADRLVQRVMLEYFEERQPFPIYHPSSFGFIRTKGPQEAIRTAIQYREEFPWCLKTDIISFFDRIPRQYLKDRVQKYLGNHSLTPLMWSAISCEVKTTSEQEKKIQSLGILRGEGVRQGMPLSPLLANIALIDFDKAIARRNFPMVRYADDLVLFFETKEAAKTGETVVRDLLANLRLSIPTLEEDSKTKIISRSDSLEFLGREIVLIKSINKFVAKISNAQIGKILDRLLDDYSFETRVKENKNFQDTIFELSKSVASYLGIYKDTYNFETFSDAVRGQARLAVNNLFREIFGEVSLAAVSPQGRKFLGIEILDSVTPNSEFDL